MGLLDRVDGSEKMITRQDLKVLGFREMFNKNVLNYWFHGSGSSYIKISMSVNARKYRACGYIGDDSRVEELAYCISDNGSQYHINKIVNPTMDDVTVVTTLVKQSK